MHVPLGAHCVYQGCQLLKFTANYFSRTITIYSNISTSEPPAYQPYYPKKEFDRFTILTVTTKEGRHQKVTTILFDAINQSSTVCEVVSGCCCHALALSGADA